MNACPSCASVPVWMFASRVSTSRKANHFIFTGCKHAAEFTKGFPDFFISTDKQPSVEAQWDAFAEVLFQAYTETWTDAERLAFRARLWPQPPPKVDYHAVATTQATPKLPPVKPYQDSADDAF